jgi:CRISPR-associated protein Cmr3
MNQWTIEITAIDPLVARDGRPFGLNQGNRMRGLPWLTPSVVAGSLRTALVKSTQNLEFTDDVLQRLRAVAAAGVFPAAGKTLFMPAPKDCIWDGTDVHAIRPAPMQEGDGCDLPAAGLSPVMLSDEQTPSDFKPTPPPAWWPMPKMVDWLLGRIDQFNFTEEFLRSPATVVRDHVQIDPCRGAADEGKLFTSVGLHLSHLERYGVAAQGDEDGDGTRAIPRRFQEIKLAVRAESDDASLPFAGFDAWHPLGGERRLAHWKQSDDGAMWQCPGEVADALKSASHIRMVLATPAIFQRGWLPGWIDPDSLQGRPPDVDVEVKLVGAAVDRWKAVSGWSLAPINERGELDPKNGKRGPKPIRRTVPAGGVYFFEIVGGDAAALKRLWLRPVSDSEQERRDGFGLALWGVWNPNA